MATPSRISEKNQKDDKSNSQLLQGSHPSRVRDEVEAKDMARTRLCKLRPAQEPPLE